MQCAGGESPVFPARYNINLPEKQVLWYSSVTAVKWSPTDSDRLRGLLWKFCPGQRSTTGQVIDFKDETTTSVLLDGYLVKLPPKYL